MGVSVEKFYVVTCDDDRFKDKHKLEAPTKEALIEKAKEAGWVQRAGNWYCPEAAPDHPAAKRGRKPKDKQEEGDVAETKESEEVSFETPAKEDGTTEWTPPAE